MGADLRNGDFLAKTWWDSIGLFGAVSKTCCHSAIWPPCEGGRGQPRIAPPRWGISRCAAGPSLLLRSSYQLRHGEAEVGERKGFREVTLLRPPVGSFLVEHRRVPGRNQHL